MKLNKILTASALTLLLVSCDLDKEPTGVSDFWKSEGDVELALNGAYEPLYEEEGFGRGQFWAQLASDDMVDNRGKTADQNVTEFRTTTNTSGGQKDNWKYMYRTINRADKVIENAPKLVVSSEKKKEIIMGEANFLKAFAYFHLAKRYGGLPLPSYLNTNEQNMKLQRSTKEETYKYIETCLKDCITLFEKHNLWKREDMDTDNGRPTLGAAYGLLAKVYAHWGKFPEAKIAAEKVIDSGQHSLNTADNNGFKNLFSVAGEKHEEVLFNLTNKAERSNGTVTSIILLSGTMSNGIGWYYFPPTESLFKAFEPGDLRREVTVKGKDDYVNFPALIGMEYNKTTLEGPDGKKMKVKKTDLPMKLTTVITDAGGKSETINWISDMSTGYMCTKYAEPYERLTGWSWETGKDIPLLRYADVLLIHAEAEIMIAGGGPSNRTQGVAAAATSFNKVRERAYGNDASKAISMPTFDDLVKERRCELAYEDERHYDLVRWGLAKEIYANGSARGDLKGDRTFDEVKNAHLPIPQGEIENTDGRLFNNPKDGYSNFK